MAFSENLQTALIKRYGYAIVPEGRRLMTRQTQDWMMNDNRVFFYVMEGCIFGGDVEYQVEVLRPLTLITPFTCEEWNTGISRSLLFKLCEDLEIAITNTDDVSSPEWKTYQSDKLLKKLSEMGIDGWYHPVEGSTYTMEICVYRPLQKCILKNVHLPLMLQPPVYAYLGTLNAIILDAKNQERFKADLKDTQLWHCLEYVVMHQKV